MVMAERLSSGAIENIYFDTTLSRPKFQSRDYVKIWKDKK